MAVTLESGSYVKFQYNLGTGPIDIINWAVRVRPGHWYTAYASRSVKCYSPCAFNYVTSQQPYLVFLHSEISRLSMWEMRNEFFDRTKSPGALLYAEKTKLL